MKENDEKEAIKELMKKKDIDKLIEKKGIEALVRKEVAVLVDVLDMDPEKPMPRRYEESDEEQEGKDALVPLKPLKDHSTYQKYFKMLDDKAWWQVELHMEDDNEESGGAVPLAVWMHVLDMDPDKPLPRYNEESDEEEEARKATAKKAPQTATASVAFSRVSSIPSTSSHRKEADAEIVREFLGKHARCVELHVTGSDGGRGEAESGGGREEEEEAQEAQGQEAGDEAEARGMRPFGSHWRGKPGKMKDSLTGEEAVQEAIFIREEPENASLVKIKFLFDTCKSLLFLFLLLYYVVFVFVLLVASLTFPVSNFSVAPNYYFSSSSYYYYPYYLLPPPLQMNRKAGGSRCTSASAA